MPTIRVETRIEAPVERCFDLARDVDLHRRSLARTGERAVGGVTTGLLGPGDTVTWEGRHFGVRQRLTARITAEIVDVKPNGTMVLQARKRIKTDEEVEQFVLTGICRADDIIADNTILSTQLYDKAVNKTHTGAVRDTTKRGFVPRLLDVINPF